MVDVGAFLTQTQSTIWLCFDGKGENEIHDAAHDTAYDVLILKLPTLVYHK